MFKRLVVIAACSAALLTSVVSAQSERQVFQDFRAQPNDLARYQYLITAMPNLSPANQDFAKQLLATVEAELGLYDEAVHDFPFDNRLPYTKLLPRAQQWPGTKSYGPIPAINADVIANSDRADDVITKLAASRRIVLVNEAHHDPHTRELTLALLPRLRALGYNYFAPEALTESGAALTKRGYPIEASGTEYLREPLYGDILREAIRLGYTIVSYDPLDETQDQDRDTVEAHNLYEKVFAKDPNARLFVHAGYAHIDKTKGNLYNAEPMAMQLMQLTGFDPLSVDQSQFRDAVPSFHGDPYHALIMEYRPREPTVLKISDSGAVWSSDPAKHDVSVILPEETGSKRPSWLKLDGQRRTWNVSSALCAETVPCVVEAHYANEPDDAIPADRYTFLHAHTSSKLFLRPGAYRLRAWGINGKTLSEQPIQVAGR
ncbi:MAG: hypothetical protein WA777_07295 [Rhodanobacter sp.]